MTTLFTLKDSKFLQIPLRKLMRYKKKSTSTIMINHINMVRDVNMDTLIQNLKRKNMIIMDIIMDMITETAIKAILMDMPDMTLRI
jgi:hypothetical protein